MSQRILRTAGAVLLIGIIHVASAVDSHQEKCTVVEGSGVRVDSCDGSKFLSCQTGRCQCLDPANQLWDYRYALQDTPSSRTRRSPKGGKGGKSGGGLKKAAVPLAVGAGGAYIGYQAGKAVGNYQNNGGNYGGGGGGTYYAVNNKNKGQNLKKEYGCYGRVGSACVLDYNNVNVVALSTTTTTTSTTTTTVVPETTTGITSENSTETTANSTTTSTPSTNVTTTDVSSAAASTSPVDLTKVPKCVRNAVCVRKLPTNFNGNSPAGVYKTEGDPRLGNCQCADGYKSTNTDQCEKIPSNSASNSKGASYFGLLSFIVVSAALQL